MRVTGRQRERERHASNTSNKGRVRGGERVTMTERQRERERHASNTSNQGRVRERRERESDNDREAARER